MKIFNQNHNTHEDSPAPKALVDAVHENLYQLSHFLKANHKQKYLPCFALMGPSHSGKTTLLRQSNIHFTQIIAQENPLCKTWLTEDALYLNIKGRCINDSEFLPAWPLIYKNIKKFRPQQALDGIVFVLNLAELLEQSSMQLSAMLNDFVAVLCEFSEQAQRPIPINLVITHCDVISGFQAYFDDLNDLELTESFGFSLTESSIDCFNQGYHELIQKLEQKLIKRLHYSQPQQKTLINHFPLQLESLNSLFTQVIQQLFEPDAAYCNYYLKSFFLCSSLQQTKVIDRLHKSLLQSFSLSLPHVENTANFSKSYFTKQLLLKDLPSSHQQTQQSAWLKQGVIASAAVFTLALGIMWSANNFRQDINIINLSANAIRQYDAITETAEQKQFAERFLHLLDATHVLHQSNRLIGKQNQQTLFIKQSNHLQQRFQNIYKNALAEKLLPLIASSINTYLQNLKPNQAEQKYAGLKAYLMLAHTQHMDIDYFMQWFEKNWEQQHGHLSANQSKKLRQLLQSSLPPVHLDMDTITETRNYINSLPKSFLAYLTLKECKTLNQKTNAKKFSLNGRTFVIPALYQKQFFIKIYQQEIQNVSKIIAHGNWVLGKNSLNHQGLNDEQVVKELRQLYLDDYKQWWGNLLSHLNFQSDQGLSGTIRSLKQLNSNKSSLSQVLNLIKDNTSPFKSLDDVGETFNEEIASQFVDINRFTQEKSQALSEIVLDLEKDLQTINRAFDTNQAAFKYAQYEFNHQHTTLYRGLEFAEQAPLTIQHWMRELIQNSWAIIINKTNKYIEHQWERRIYPEYVRHIQGRYPFAKDKTVELKDFNRFFAYKGALNQFFETHIKPFLAINEANWTLKTTHEKTIQLSSTAIQQFIRAHLIRKMYFNPDLDKTVFKFKLTPIKLADNIKEITFDIDGQHYYSYGGSLRSHEFSWPHSGKTPQLSIDIVNKDGKHTMINKQGDWALYQLFDSFPLEQSGIESLEYTFKLTLEGQSSLFKLETEDVINPLVPNIVQLLELPQQLIAEA